MTTDLTTLAAQIEERLTEDETTAHAATETAGQWFQPGPGAGEWTLRNNRAIVESPAGIIVFDEGCPTDAQGAHIARNDPAGVLRRVAVTRELVAAILAEPHDPARNPAGHQRVARLLGIIATEWEEKEDGQ